MKPQECREVVDFVDRTLQTVVRRDQSVEVENWELRREVEDLKDQLADIEREVKDKDSEIEDLRHENGILSDDVADLKDQVEMRGLLESREYQEWEHEGRADGLERNLAEADQTIDQLLVKLQIAQEVIAEKNRLLDERRRLGD